MTEGLAVIWEGSEGVGVGSTNGWMEWVEPREVLKLRYNELMEVIGSGGGGGEKKNEDDHGDRPGSHG